MSNLRSIMFAAAVAVFSLPPAAHAVTMVTTDTFNISGTYSIIPQTDPMIGGTLSVEAVTDANRDRCGCNSLGAASFDLYRHTQSICRW